MKRPKAVVLDYAGTLVEEAGFDPRAGMWAVWLTPPNAAPSEMPDLTVHGWPELTARFLEAD